MNAMNTMNAVIRHAKVSVPLGCHVIRTFRVFLFLRSLRACIRPQQGLFLCLCPRRRGKRYSWVIFNESRWP